MKTAYPVVISRDGDDRLVSVPDCEIDTQGLSVVDAIELARDAISLWCVCQEDLGKTLPTPSNPADVPHSPDEMVALLVV
jgi:predicted RNase H-like HicB family nuclease